MGSQLNANGVAANQFGSVTSSGIDYHAIKFSPTYNADSSIALVYTCGPDVGGMSSDNATYYNMVIHDINQNTTLDYAHGFEGIEVKNPLLQPGLRQAGAS